jgi:hypothetical protein
MLYEENEESIALNPDGNICYLEKNNPYKDIETTENFHSDAENLQIYSRFIRVVTIIDFVVTCFNLSLTFPYFLITAFISLSGYFGAVNYNNTMLTFYLFYQFLKIISKSIFVYYNYKSKIIIFVLISELYDSYVIVITNKLMRLINRALIASL